MYGKKLAVLVLVAVMALLVAACGNGAGDEGVNPTIRIAKIPWVHEWVPVHVMEQVFTEMGYPVDVVEADIGFTFMGLAQDDLDIYPDLWLPTLHSSYMEQYDGQIDKVGLLYEEGPIGWAVPSYVDIDSIPELLGKEELFDNVVVGVEPSSGMMETSELTIAEYGLDLELMEGSTASMLAEVEWATTNREPIIFLAWRPHTMFAQYDIKILEDPKGLWALDDCYFGVSMGLQDRAPEIYAFLEQFQMPIPEIEKVMLWMEDEGIEVEVATARWVEQNRDYIDGIIAEIRSY